MAGDDDYLPDEEFEEINADAEISDDGAETQDDVADEDEDVE